MGFGIFSRSAQVQIKQHFFKSTNLSVSLFEVPHPPPIFFYLLIQSGSFEIHLLVFFLCV